MRRPFEPDIVDLFEIDPMGMASRNPEALFIDDVETAGPDRHLTAAVQARLGPIAGEWLRAEPR